ncbi:LPS export ABC transporter permease LptF [Acidocella aminolytica]|uniref:LPS export ABC transporter permease LptF n=1 Tax=Acidocella aminolytica TaxID=33998 RepID=UPI000923D9A1|nr:LPS export ABC transporter permease LptF [Acidocella aminolytica]SHE96345.1 lipopolysaccharide export system permease protein [Acidocella aminolytica 101 = DSM 11237]
MKTDRYLLAEIARPFAAVLGILALLFAGYSLTRILSDAVSGLLPVGAIAALTSLKVLIALDVLIPISLFIAVVAGFGRLQADSEVTAMQALGMGPRQLLRPVLRLALGLAVLVACLSIFVRPWAYATSHNITRHAAVALNVNAMEPGTFYASQDGREVIFLGRRAGPHAPAQNVFVAKRRGSHVEVISAATATPAVKGADGQRNVHLSGAHVYEFDRSNPASDESLQAAGMNVNPDTAKLAPVRYSPVAASTGHLLASRDPADIAERQWRFSTGLSTLLLALLGAILSRGRPRQNRYARFGPAILAYSAYYLLCTTARTWVEHGQVGRLPGLWWAPALLVLAMLLVWYGPALRRRFRAPPNAPPPMPNPRQAAQPVSWRPASSQDAA